MDNNNLPFLHRGMLDFEKTAQFSLIVDVWSIKSDTLKISGLTKSGPFVFNFACNSAGTKQTQQFGMTDIPIFLSVDTPTGLNQRGQIYCRVSLSINGTQNFSLCTGYVTDATSVSFPYGLKENPQSLPGCMYTTTTADPAAGAEFTYTVPTGVTVFVKSVYFTLVADATVANRRAGLVFRSGADIIAAAVPTTAQTANTTYKYTYARGLSAFADGAGFNMQVTLPDDIKLEAGDTITSLTTGIQAGDNLSAAVVYAETLLLATG